MNEKLRLALIDVEQELCQVSNKYPAFHSPHEGYAVLLEEVEELKSEIFCNPITRSPAAMRAEATQVAAMALRFIMDLC